MSIRIVSETDGKVQMNILIIHPNKVLEYFIVPNPNKKEPAKVLLKAYDGGIYVSRGPDHHGRIICGDRVHLDPDTEVQIIDPVMYDYMCD